MRLAVATSWLLAPEQMLGGVAVAVTATGEAQEVEGNERSTALGLYLQRHPHLRAFAESPGCAVMRVRVETYLVARGLGEISVWRARPKDEPAEFRQRDPAEPRST
jgi:hypothetical protein